MHIVFGIVNELYKQGEDHYILVKADNGDLSLKKEILEELSDLGVFLGALSIRLRFHAFTSGICNNLIQDAVIELMNAKADFLLKEMNEMLQPSRIQEVKNAVIDMTTLCAEDHSCSMLMAHPVFDALRTHIMDLSSCLDESASMADVASSFALPRLSLEDIAVLFCGDFQKVQRILMDLAVDRNLNVTMDDPTQKMRRRGRLVSYGYQRDADVIFVFANIAETVEKAVASFLDFDWGSVFASESDTDEDSVKEALISLQFVALPVLMTKQNFSFLSSLLQLSDSVKEQRTAKELRKMYWDVADTLKAKRSNLEEVKERESYDPAFDPHSTLFSHQTHTAERLWLENEVEELTIKKTSLGEQMRDAENQLRRLQSEICLRLSSSLRDLLLTGLRCLSRIFGYDAGYFESYLKTDDEISGPYALFIQNAASASIMILRDRGGIKSESRYRCGCSL